jgi:hypothetical protein
MPRARSSGCRPRGRVPYGEIRWPWARGAGTAQRASSAWAGGATLHRQSRHCNIFEGFAFVAGCFRSSRWETACEWASRSSSTTARSMSASRPAGRAVARARQVAKSLAKAQLSELRDPLELGVGALVLTGSRRTVTPGLSVELPTAGWRYGPLGRSVSFGSQPRRCLVAVCEQRADSFAIRAHNRLR